MNMNLSEALSDVAKIDALMYAIERSFFDIGVDPEDLAKADRGMNVFYAMWDVVGSLSNNLEKLAGDERVVDALNAAKESRCANCTLKKKESEAGRQK